MEKKEITAEEIHAQDTALRQDLDDALANCMKCGNCQAVCPIYKEIHLDAPSVFISVLPASQALLI